MITRERQEAVADVAGPVRVVWVSRWRVHVQNNVGNNKYIYIYSGLDFWVYRLWDLKADLKRAGYGGESNTRDGLHTLRWCTGVLMGCAGGSGWTQPQARETQCKLICSILYSI